MFYEHIYHTFVTWGTSTDEVTCPNVDEVTCPNVEEVTCPNVEEVMCTHNYIMGSHAYSIIRSNTFLNVHRREISII